MYIEDAEYQDWKEDSYDYNKPKISFFTKKPLNNTKVIAQDWWLKPMLVSSAVWCSESGSKGRYVSDYKKVAFLLEILCTPMMKRDRDSQIYPQYYAILVPPVYLI